MASEDFFPIHRVVGGDKPEIVYLAFGDGKDKIAVAGRTGVLYVLTEPFFQAVDFRRKGRACKDGFLDAIEPCLFETFDCAVAQFVIAYVVGDEVYSDGHFHGI